MIGLLTEITLKTIWFTGQKIFDLTYWVVYGNNNTQLDIIQKQLEDQYILINNIQNMIKNTEKTE